MRPAALAGERDGLDLDIDLRAFAGLADVECRIIQTIPDYQTPRLYHYQTTRLPDYLPGLEDSRLTDYTQSIHHHTWVFSLKTLRITGS